MMEEGAPDLRDLVRLPVILFPQRVWFDRGLVWLVCSCGAELF